MAVSDAEAVAYNLNRANIYMGMKFYAIFPNGTKVPLSEISAHMAANPELRPLKTFDDGGTGMGYRLVLVVEMTTPNADGSESLYARQAFYYSTGANSKMDDTWLPFDGITWGEFSDSRPIPGSRTIAVPGDGPPGPGGVRTSANAYIDKSPFFISTHGARFIRIRGLLGDAPVPEAAFLYYGNFLPEPELSDRIGPFSHAMASYILGGTNWAEHGPGDFLYYAGGSLRDKKRANYPNLEVLRAATTPPRPTNPDFVFLRTNPDALPITSVTEINAYISRNGAISYMNGFLNTGLSLPTLTDLSVSVVQEDRRFLLPIFSMVDQVRNQLHVVMIAYRTGAIASDVATLAAEIQSRLVDLGVVNAPTPFRVQDHLDRIVFEIYKPNNVQGGRRETRRFKMPRKYSKKYCKKTPCKRMGFTQRSSCRPYKNCF